MVEALAPFLLALQNNASLLAHQDKTTCQLHLITPLNNGINELIQESSTNRPLSNLSREI